MIKKKIMAGLLACTLILTMLPLSILRSNALMEGDFAYTVLSETQKTCKITDYVGYATELVIPSSLGEYTVKSIASNAFEWCDGLTTIIIPDSVTTIGQHAFSNCDALAEITIPNGVLDVGNEAFFPAMLCVQYM